MVKCPICRQRHVEVDDDPRCTRCWLDDRLPAQIEMNFESFGRRSMNIYVDKGADRGTVYSLWMLKGPVPHLEKVGFVLPAQRYHKGDLAKVPSKGKRIIRWGSTDVSR